jgi:hypothetical protein
MLHVHQVGCCMVLAECKLARGTLLLLTLWRPASEARVLPYGNRGSCILPLALLPDTAAQTQVLPPMLPASCTQRHLESRPSRVLLQPCRLRVSQMLA